MCVIRGMALIAAAVVVGGAKDVLPVLNSFA